MFTPVGDKLAICFAYRLHMVPKITVLRMQQVADEFEVHLNSVENWRQHWGKFGLVGLFGGRHTGRPRKLSDEEQRELGWVFRSLCIDVNYA